jgi:hypothetical protein
MKYTSATTPAILNCGSDYKVSPYGPAQPDRESIYTDTREEAEAEAELSVLVAHTELAAYKREMGILRGYLLSSKFHEDTTVQVNDVLMRMEQIHERAQLQGREDAEAMMAGCHPQAG